MTIQKRTRCTSATQKRVENIKAIIANMFAHGRMGRDEINLFLGMSPSGGRKYIRELVEAKAITVVDFEPSHPNGNYGAPIFGLVDDPQAIEAFLKELDNMPKNLTQRRAMVDHNSTGPRMQKVQAEDGRSIHMLRDDVEHKPRAVRFRIPAPDPVLAAFFGLAAPVESLL